MTAGDFGGEWMGSECLVEASTTPIDRRPAAFAERRRGVIGSRGLAAHGARMYYSAFERNHSFDELLCLGDPLERPERRERR
jgi:hypothetical protein